MSQANDSVTVTPGAGATIATHLAGGKEHQVVMVADSSGHIEGSAETWLLWIPTSATAASKRWFDLFNATGSGKIIDVRGIWAVPLGAVVTGTYFIPCDFFRVSTVGTGGTAATSSSIVGTTPGFAPMDTSNTALPAGITARAIPTGGSTVTNHLWRGYVPTEETNAATYMSAVMNLIPAGEFRQPLTLRESQGLLVQEDATATPVGSMGWLVQFTVE